MSKITAKQRALAEKLMAAHNKKEVYVNVVSGHMHFSKAGALIGAGKKEENLEKVTAAVEASDSEKSKETSEAVLALRSEYKELSGKSAHHSWGEEALTEKIAELKEQEEKAKQPAS